MAVTHAFKSRNPKTELKKEKTTTTTKKPIYSLTWRLMARENMDSNDIV